jgi:hypothetical protein
MSQKIVISREFNGISLTREDVKLLAILGHPVAIREYSSTKSYFNECTYRIKRDDKKLVAVCKRSYNEPILRMVVVEIPDNIKREIIYGDISCALKHRLLK